jgi:cathepsin X
MLRVTLVTAASAAFHGYRPELAPPHLAEYVKTPLPHTYTAPEDLPAEFSWRNISGRNYLTALLNQHIPTYCGSCWLHGSMSVLNDRIKIARGGEGPDVMLARQVILNCGNDTAGSCKGGSDAGVYDWVMKNGIPDETCQQYDALDHECSAYRTCMNCDAPDFVKPGQQMCYPVQRYGKVFVDEWGPLNMSVHNMKAEVYRRGPISCSIDSSPLEQGHYTRGRVVDVHRRPDGKPDWETDHIVSVVGWGHDGSTEYWLVRNSWGRYWGEEGFFRVAVGSNVMNIEQSGCNWAVPKWPPVTQDYGPSDAGHLFPTGDGPHDLRVYV